MIPRRRVPLLPGLAAVLIVLLVGCSGPRHMHEGMSRDEVSNQLGRPIRIEKHPDRSESWYYNTVKKSRQASWSNNYIRPGESVYERDLRIDMNDGVVGGVEFGTTETYEEQPLRFDANGRLASSPPHSFLPSD